MGLYRECPVKRLALFQLDPTLNPWPWVKPWPGRVNQGLHFLRLLLAGSSADIACRPEKRELESKEVNQSDEKGHERGVTWDVPPLLTVLDGDSHRGYYNPC